MRSDSWYPNDTGIYNTNVYVVFQQLIRMTQSQRRQVCKKFQEYYNISLEDALNARLSQFNTITAPFASKSQFQLQSSITITRKC